MAEKFTINPANLDFNLPDELIAQEPLKIRDQARLMVLDRSDRSLRHMRFYNLKDLLRSGDVLVVNKARVNHAKLVGRKPTGGRVEILLVAPLAENKDWRCLIRPELKAGTTVSVGTSGRATLIRRTEIGENIVRFEGPDPDGILETEGLIPLPPYIKRTEGDPRSKDDECYYQTVYASSPGSLAAPTAGLHFTGDLLRDLRQMGVVIVEILLHVGWGTFKPISKSVDDHHMLSETYEVGPEEFRALRQAKIDSRRVIAVGTTATRVLESLTAEDGEDRLRGDTALFIRPGFSFHWLDGLITNFHVPRSTPVALTSAFCGVSFLEKAYEEAIREKYRFFSYGDAMLIL